MTARKTILAEEVEQGEIPAGVVSATAMTTTPARETAPPPEPLPLPSARLAMKIVNCMRDVGTVEKRGRNEFHKYDYATEADVARAVREVFIKHQLAWVPRITGLDGAQRQTAKGGTDYVATVHLTVALIDAETGETFEMPWIGIGQDSGEKGIYKAITGGLKYLQQKLLLIPTGDDPEKDEAQRGEVKKEKKERPPAGYPTVSEEEIAMIRGVAKPRGFLFSTNDDPKDVRNLRNVLAEVAGVRGLRGVFPKDKLDALIAKLNTFDVIPASEEGEQPA